MLLKLVRIFLKRLYWLISRVLMNLEIKLATRIYFQRLFGPFQETLGNRGSKKVKFFVVAIEHNPSQLSQFHCNFFFFSLFIMLFVDQQIISCTHKHIKRNRKNTMKRKITTSLDKKQRTQKHKKDGKICSTTFFFRKILVKQHVAESIQ